MMELARNENRFDILRLLAAWLVLYSHAFALAGRVDDEPFRRLTGFLAGEVGVSVFFVLSGYLVVQSLERSPSVWNFLWRRALRIYPALWMVVLLCTAVLGPWVSQLDAGTYWASTTTYAYLLNASAYWIQNALPGVFEGNPWPVAVNGSLWSLTYETACYLLLALVGWLPGVLRIKVIVALALLMAWWLGFALMNPEAGETVLWGVSPGMLFVKLGSVFFLGAALGLLRERFQPRGWQGALLVLCALLLSGPARPLLFQLGVAWLALALALRAKWLPAIPSRMGDWSYGLYLYGFPVQQTLAHFGVHERGLAVYIAGSTVITAMLAAMSWYWVEKPALQLRRRM
ncbi:acyltransferase [Paracidovorax wautersii]|uniref:Peptidoglycan/LPS O-acetylase OafA/YrhL n=1 Tax=Paracidovorax wautersii TaxID=1177982 RepID=A0ABU1I8L8_9BURK|nr:acyltransferase [Paracidovorax wautersii]MDR6212843.1 peptidoglycan/LPS O-acetylase OafA/YrhL [Paracidovorax wautersii]